MGARVWTFRCVASAVRSTMNSRADCSLAAVAMTVCPASPVDVAGPEHVGIGMDWDGGGGVEGMQSVADLPKITAWLLRKGYSEQQIANIWGGNVLRVMEQVQAHARAQAGK